MSASISIYIFAKTFKSWLNFSPFYQYFCLGILVLKLTFIRQHLDQNRTLDPPSHNLAFLLAQVISGSVSRRHTQKPFFLKGWRHKVSTVEGKGVVNKKKSEHLSSGLVAYCAGSNPSTYFCSTNFGFLELWHCHMLRFTTDHTSRRQFGPCILQTLWLRCSTYSLHF